MKLVAVVSALVLSVMPLRAPEPGQIGSRIWITDITIISPENLDYIAEGSVLIEDGRIVRIERQKKVKVGADATIFFGKGQFLIPGLIDSHVHLASVPGMQLNFDPNAARPPMFGEYFKQLPRSYLYFGYTTLVDLAVVDRRTLDEFRQAPLHPDVYDCGPSLPIANGYPMSFAPPAQRFRLFPNFIYDPRQAATIPSEYLEKDHTPAAAVSHVKDSGGVCVKTYFERGFGRDRNLPVISTDALSQVRKAATQDGLVLMMHANSFEAQKFAVDGNVDVIAHGMWNWGDLQDQPGLPPEIKSLLDRVVDKRIGYQPTIQVMGGLRAYFDSDYLKTEAIPKLIPADMLEWFNSPQGKWFKKEISEDDVPDPNMLERFDNGPIRRVRQVVRYLAAKDANFLFGTDTPSAPTYGNLPGLNGYLEMKQLQQAGLSLEQIFRAATLNNARTFKIDSQVGTIEPGKIANLVVLRKSPLESVDAYDSIVGVWVHGKQVSRSSLKINANE
jgi:hypothetical protein